MTRWGWRGTLAGLGALLLWGTGGAAAQCAIVPTDLARGVGIVDRFSSPQVVGGTASLTNLMVNVKDCGAKGDGVADDTPAIQAAITLVSTAISAPNALAGGVVYFPAGKYIITSTIRVPVAQNAGQVILRGAGMRVAYLYASGPTTSYTPTGTAAVPAIVLFGCAVPDNASTGPYPCQTQYVGMENLSVSGTLLTGAGNVRGIVLTECQFCWLENVIVEAFPNSSVGVYLLGATVTGGLGTGTTAQHTRLSRFVNLVVTSIGSGAAARPSAMVLQNADENDFYNSSFGTTAGLTPANDSIATVWVQLGRNNRFFGCLYNGDNGNSGPYTGLVFGPPRNEAGVANGSVLQNQDYGAVSEGFDIGVWFHGDASGNTVGNQVLGYNASITTTPYRDDNPALNPGGFAGGGNGGNMVHSPFANIMYQAVGSPSIPLGLFGVNATTPTVGGSDTWRTQNSSATIITDFLAPTSASLDGRQITVFVNDANTTIRDVNNGGGGHIRNLGRQDIVGVVGTVVAYRNIAGTWYQVTPAMTANTVGQALLLPTAVKTAIGANPAVTTQYRVENLLFQNAGLTTTSASDVSVTSFSLLGNSLNTNAQAIRISLRGSAVTGTGAPNLKFGATTLCTGSITAGNAYELDAVVTRTGAATQIAVCTVENGTALSVNTRTTPTETLSGAVTVDFRGAITAGTLNVDYAQVEYLAQ